MKNFFAAIGFLVVSAALMPVIVAGVGYTVDKVKSKNENENENDNI